MSKKQYTSSEKCFRGLFYSLGIVFLACGIIVSSKAGFGTPPVIAPASAVTAIYGISIGATSFIEYVLFAVAEYIIKGSRFRKIDLLQLPFSVVFSSLLNMFSAMLPDVTSLAGRALCLAVGIVLTGIGVAMMISADLVPNPADGLVAAIAHKAGKSLGLIKNIFDLACAVAGIVLSLLLCGRVVAVGIGTLMSMLFIGRVVAVFNHLFLGKMKKLMGMDV